MKVPSKRELLQIVFNYSDDINFKDLISFIKIILKNHIHFLVNDTTSSSDNSLQFRKNLQ